MKILQTLYYLTGIYSRVIRPSIKDNERNERNERKIFEINQKLDENITKLVTCSFELFSPKVKEFIIDQNLSDDCARFVIYYFTMAVHNAKEKPWSFKEPDDDQTIDALKQWIEYYDHLP